MASFNKANEIPILEVCDLLGIEYHKSGSNEYRAKSVFLPGNNETCLSINTSKNTWHDFKAPEKFGGGSLNLYAYVKYGSYEDNENLKKAACELLGENADDSFYDSSYREQRNAEKEKFLNEIKSAHEFLINSDEEPAQYTRDYLYKRGFNDEIIKRYQFGLKQVDMLTIDKETGQDSIKCKEWRLIIPYLNEDNIPFYMCSRDLPKYQHTRKQNSKYKKLYAQNKKYIHNGVFGLNSIPKKNSDCDLLFIGEGVLDAISIMQAGYSVLCSVGGCFSADMLKTVIKIAKKFKKIILCYDNDIESKAGYKFAYAIGEAFRNEHINFYTIDNYGTGNKDVNDYYVNGGSIPKLEDYAKNGYIFMAEQFCNIKFDGLSYQGLSTDDKNKFSKEMRIFINTIKDVTDETTYKAIRSIILAYYPEKLLKQIEKGQTQKELIIELRDMFLNTHEHIFHCGSKKGGLYYKYNKSLGIWYNISDATLESSISALTGHTEMPNTIKNVAEAVTTYIHIEENNVPEFNSKPLMNFSNGVLELDTGNFREHRPDDYLTMVTTYAYDKNATCPKFMKFLNEITAEDESRKIFLQQSGGYILIEDCRFQKCFHFIGGGSNGKSAYLKIIEAVFNDRNKNKNSRINTITHVEPKDLNMPYNRAALQYSILNISADVNENLYGSESYIKNISSGDTINASFKYGDDYSYTPRAKLFISSNQLLKMRDPTKALLRRFMFCEFIVDFTGREDSTLPDRIIADELAGIFNFFYQGYKDILSQGFISECIDQRKNLAKFAEVINPVLSFWYDYKDNTIIEATYHEVKTSELYTKYSEWCKANGVMPYNSQIFQDTFFKTLERIAGILIQKTRKRENDGKQPYIYKISIKPIELEPEEQQQPEQQASNIEPIEKQDFINMSKREIQKYFAQFIPDLNMKKIKQELARANIINFARYNCISACELDALNRTYDEKGIVSGQVIDGVFKAK